MRSVLLTVCWLMRTAVLAGEYPSSFVMQSYYNGKYVELFQPFSLCGMLEKLTLVQNSITDVNLDESQCTIGCVNKTRDAFRIGIYACDGGLVNFELPISFTDMDFSVQYTDAQFIARGQLLAQRLYLQLVPNLSCLQHGQSASCIRVTKYEKVFEPLVALKEHQATGSLDIGINTNVWRKTLMNGDANVQSMSALLFTNSLIFTLLLA